MDELNKKDIDEEESTIEDLEGGKREKHNNVEPSYLEQPLVSLDLMDDAEGKATSSHERGNLEKLLVQKEEELRQKHDQWLRALAEHENYKKRMAHEKANILKFGNESLMRELLPVIDNLELSLEHARKTKNVDTLIEGIELVRKEFLRKLEKFGLRVISAQREKFDPTRHESIAQIETGDYPEDTVVEELQKGYFIHDRLLRPAKVTLAKPSHGIGKEPLTSEETTKASKIT
ncbi:MAG: nucleotide exchange factor GrpE [Pseudomonadota bacterium]